MRGRGGYKFWRYQFPALAWGLFIFFLSSIPSTVIPITAPIGLDKAFHVVIFFVFCLLLNRAFENQERYPALARNRLLFSFLIVIGYGVLDELYQTIVPGRLADYMDAVADAVGGLLCTLYLLLLRKRQSIRETRGAGSPMS